jgi:hypothetical protein
VITTFSLFVAGGYILYLVRKEDDDDSEDGDRQNTPFDLEDEYVMGDYEDSLPGDPTHRTGSSYNNVPPADDVSSYNDQDNSGTDASSRAGRPPQPPGASEFPALSTLPITVISGAQQHETDMMRVSHLTVDEDHPGEWVGGDRHHQQQDSEITFTQDEAGDQDAENAPSHMMGGFQLQIQDLDDIVE